MGEEEGERERVSGRDMEVTLAVGRRMGEEE